MKEAKEPSQMMMGDREREGGVAPRRACTPRWRKTGKEQVCLPKVSGSGGHTRQGDRCWVSRTRPSSDPTRYLMARAPRERRARDKRAQKPGKVERSQDKDRLRSVQEGHWDG